MSAEDQRRFAEVGGYRKLAANLRHGRRNMLPEESVQTWTIPVPGKFRVDVSYLDIETWKVPTGGPIDIGYIMQNGELLKNRWSVFMAGVSSFGRITLLERTGSEYWMLSAIRDAISSQTVVYSATRQFDEMILKGRFTNARRAHEPTAFYPSMTDAEDLDWLCLPPFHQHIERGADVDGRDVVKEYNHGGQVGIDKVRVHNLRDVVELIMWDGSPDRACHMWCTRVMTDIEFALNVINRA